MQGVGSEETGVEGAFLSSCEEAKCLIWEGMWGVRGGAVCVVRSHMPASTITTAG